MEELPYRDVSRGQTNCYESYMPFFSTLLLLFAAGLLVLGLWLILDGVCRLVRDRTRPPGGGEAGGKLKRESESEKEHADDRAA
jgi:hypothetical protein